MKTLKLLSFFLFATLFSCTEENYYYSNDNDGKVNIYIEGNITNAEAQAQLEEEMGYQTESIIVQYTTQLTDITIKAKYKLRTIVFYDNNLELRNIKLDGNNTKISYIGISNSKQNTNINLSGFSEADVIQIFTYGYKTDPTTGYSIGTTNTTNIVCNDLIKINQQLTFIASVENGNAIAFNDLKIVEANNPNLFWSYWRGKFNTIDFPLLEEMSNLRLAYYEGQYANVPYYEIGLSIDELELPNLLKINSFISDDAVGVNKLKFPKLIEMNEFLVDCYLQSIHTYEITYHDERFYFPLLNNCKLFSLKMKNFDSNAVNYYLNKFLTIQPASGKWIGLYGEPPTGQGLVDKQNLIDNGNNVSTN